MIGKNRIRSVDVMRGVAMCLVLLSHSQFFIDEQSLPAIVFIALNSCTRIASVAFMFISGMMISYFLCAKGDWRSVYARFAKRAAFLLIVIHPIIEVAQYYYNENNSDFLNRLYHNYPITDTIALSMLIAPLIFRVAGPTSRIVIIVLLLAICPPVKAFYHPESSLLQIITVSLFGSVDENNAIVLVFWPLLPWLGIFMSGSLLGEIIARVRGNSLPLAEMTKRLQVIAFRLTIVGLFSTIAYKVLKYNYVDIWSPNVFVSIYPSRTTSLLPIYIAILLYVFSKLATNIDLHGRYNRIVWSVSVFGRNSLFTYVTQFVVVLSIPTLAGLRGQLNLWQYMIFLGVVSLACWIIAYMYGRLRGRIYASDYLILKNSFRAPGISKTGETATIHPQANEIDQKSDRGE